MSGRIPVKGGEDGLFFGGCRRAVTVKTAGEKTPREFRNGFIPGGRSGTTVRFRLATIP